MSINACAFGAVEKKRLEYLMNMGSRVGSWYLHGQFGITLREKQLEWLLSLWSRNCTLENTESCCIGFGLVKGEVFVEICYWDKLASPIGSIYLAATEEGLVYSATSREGGKEMHAWLAEHLPNCIFKQGSNPTLNTAKQQLTAYFTGESKVLDVPLKLIGTTFQKSVWQALRTIPYGETRTYGQIAVQVGRPKGPRAVGQANHNNPVSIFVP